MTRAIPVRKTTVSHVAVTILDNWVITYGILTHLFTDNGPQFVGGLFAKLCALLRTEQLATKAYHTHKNGQTKRKN